MTEKKKATTGVRKHSMSNAVACRDKGTCTLCRVCPFAVCTNFGFSFPPTEMDFWCKNEKRTKGKISALFYPASNYLSTQRIYKSSLRPVWTAMLSIPLEWIPHPPINSPQHFRLLTFLANTLLQVNKRVSLLKMKIDFLSEIWPLERNTLMQKRGPYTCQFIVLN